MTREKTPPRYKVGDLVQQVAAYPHQVSNAMIVQVLEPGVWSDYLGWDYVAQVTDGGLIHVPVGKRIHIGEGDGYKVIGNAAPVPSPPPVPTPVPQPAPSPQAGWFARLLHWFLRLFGF